MSSALQASTIDIPDAVTAERAVTEARDFFGRALGAWASDLLALRAAGLATPVWSDATPAGYGNLAA